MQSKFWFWARRTFALGFGLGLGFVLPWLIYLDQIVKARFDLSQPAVPSRVYARPLVLTLGAPLKLENLRAELALLRYLEQGTASVPGSFSSAGTRVLLHSRAFAFDDRAQPPRRVLVRLEGGKISALTDADRGTALSSWRLDPLHIATLFGSDSTERLPIPIEQMPNTLVQGLQAVEDRNFKSHFGVDPMGLARAMWTNLRRGRLSQGGSTLTQQLVKNTLLSNERSLSRKLKEMGMALMLERRFDKKTILEAYLNRIVLGQSGSQVVQGFPAASEFYFGRPLEDLATQDIALLIGLLKANSSYEPRRNPKAAFERRNVVLSLFLETGLIDAGAYDVARSQPINVISKPLAARDRYPAFVQLVRQQIKRSFPPDVLSTQGLSILSTLDPLAQEQAEKALTSTLASLDKTELLQGAVVLTDNATGEIAALVGARDPRGSQFNNALDAKRPVGSLLKPFVYLLALSQPNRYSLGSLISDAPLRVALGGGRFWSPQNYDRKSHGDVALIDALAKSYNLAAARVGVELGVDRLALLIASLGVATPMPAQPSLILGGAEFSPLEVAQLYQALANGGRVAPLSSVRAVLDRGGTALRRYPQTSMKQPDAAAIKLISFALNETTRSGTAASLSRQIRIEVAGKTGTSNDQRDSWYAGYTGSHLGIVWLGRSDNQSIGLTGASGALKVWSALFKTLASAPLKFELPERTRWVPFDVGAGCESLRFLPVLSEREPSNAKSCMQFLTAP